MTFKITRWEQGLPSEEDLLRIMQSEGLSPYSWSNSSGDKYSAHRHDYDKVIYVVTGSIRFGMPELGENASLKPGDRLDLSAGVLHEAVVGPEGVRCLESHN